MTAYLRPTGSFIVRQLAAQSLMKAAKASWRFYAYIRRKPGSGLGGIKSLARLAHCIVVELGPLEQLM